MNLALVTLAISAGLVSFLSPCGIALLPAYISYSLHEKQQTYKKSVLAGLKNGSAVALGLLLIYTLVGTIIILIGSRIREVVSWISLTLGILLIIIGIFSLFIKEFNLKTPKIMLNNKRSTVLEYIGFGVAYGFAVMSCTLPVFLSIVLSALTIGTKDAIIIFLLYAGSAALVVIKITIITSLSSTTLLKKIAKIFPYLRIISSILIIVAGSYVVYYQVAINQILVPL
ncbi:MAG: hypothetical protein O2779_03870 [Nanoarchaeota archaeon]|nr:hypothetical protein [Nanoarchaeota archaeon]